MLAHRERRRFTPEEYLLLEERSERKCEFLDGEIFAMGGRSLEHNLIQNNLYSELRQALRGGSCRAYTADVRLFIPRHNLFTYPDVMVVCGQSALLPGRKDTLTDAHWIAEILSDSTRDYDRGDKFLFYRTLPSLTEYLVVDQSRVWCERHTLERPGQWVVREYASRADSLELPALQLTLPVASLYLDVDL